MNRTSFYTHMQEVINWAKMKYRFDINYVRMALTENIEFLEIAHPYFTTIRLFKSMISILNGHEKNQSFETWEVNLVLVSIREIIDFEDEIMRPLDKSDDQKERQAGIECLQKVRHLEILCVIIEKAFYQSKKQQA